MFISTAKFSQFTNSSCWVISSKTRGKLTIFFPAFPLKWNVKMWSIRKENYHYMTNMTHVEWHSFNRVNWNKWIMRWNHLGWFSVNNVLLVSDSRSSRSLSGTAQSSLQHSSWPAPAISMQHNRWAYAGTFSKIFQQHRIACFRPKQGPKQNTTK